VSQSCQQFVIFVDIGSLPSCERVTFLSRPQRAVVQGPSHALPQDVSREKVLLIRLEGHVPHCEFGEFSGECHTGTPLRLTFVYIYVGIWTIAHKRIQTSNSGFKKYKE
jgi:hypothetical protein